MSSSEARPIHLRASRIHHERDIVAFEKDTPDGFLLFLLDVDFLSLVHHYVHVLIEAHDHTFNAHLRVVEEPDLDAGLTLEIPEDLINRQRHDLLQLLVRPGRSVQREQAHFTRLVLGCIEAKFCN